MKKYFVSLIFLFTAFISCKKKTAINGSMTVIVNGDSTWTTTDVTTENDNGVVYIDGANSSINKEVMLTLNNYEAGNHTYTIQNTGATPNVNQSGAQYQSGSYGYFAYDGQIVITGSTTKTIEGSFDFQGSGAHVTGTFTVPLP